MKAKVIIENGKTSIELTPENNFESGALQKAYDYKNPFETEIDKTYNRGVNEYKLNVIIDQSPNQKPL